MKKFLPLTVIGIGADGPKGLSPETVEEIRSAEILVGGKRHLSYFRGVGRRRIAIEGDLDKVFAPVQMRWAAEKTVVLASGDPLCFGIGDYLQRHFPSRYLRFVPHVSSLQLAFARIRESWQDAQIVSLHGRPIEHLHSALRRGVRKIAVLTDAKNHPGAIARELRSLGITDAKLWVLENLGTAEEKASAWSVARLNGRRFSPLNVAILLRREKNEEKAQPVLGLPDAFFEKRIVREGMITKEEVRVLALAKLQLKPGMTFWDVGSCTGSVAIEAKRICPGLSVWAIERHKEDVARLQRNVRRALTGPLHVVYGEAPEIFTRIAGNPHRIFIGGHGGRLKEILAACHKRLRPGGRIVVNAVLPETAQTVRAFFQQRGYAQETLRVECIKQGPGHRTDTHHPIEIVYGQKRK